jgi:hypothetical protein
MRLSILFLLLLPLLAFAQDMDACGAQEGSCKESCCASVGGQFTQTSEQYSCNTEDDPVITQPLDSCNLRCNVATLECASPGSGCSSEYGSCVSSCMGQGNRLEACDSQCIDSAATCINGKTEMPSSCCGPAFLLGLVAFGAFYNRK